MSYHALPAGVAAVLLLVSACARSTGTATSSDTVASAPAPCRPHTHEPINEPLEVWQRLRACLAAGHAKGALTFVDAKSQDFYRDIFAEFGEDLPAIQSDWPKTPQFVRNDGVIAQYAIIVDAEEDSYLVDFIRHKDGGWYVVSF
jgi:hypothetical protein